MYFLFGLFIISKGERKAFSLFSFFVISRVKQMSRNIIGLNQIIQMNKYMTWVTPPPPPAPLHPPYALPNLPHNATLYYYYCFYFSYYKIYIQPVSLKAFASADCVQPSELFSRDRQYNVYIHIFSTILFFFS